MRSWRYAMVVDDNTIIDWFEEPGINDTGDDEDPYTESTPDKVLEWLKANPR
jgi:peroxiredoxin